MASHSHETVRQFDKDIYLATLFAPDEKQPHLFAIHAFAAEIARIRHLVSDSHIGEIRLQWWRDTVAQIFDGVAQEHPVAQELALAVKAHQLPKSSFINLIDAHQFDLYADQMPSLNDLEGYLGETSSAVIQLACVILDPQQSSHSAQASGLAGVAFGLSRLLASPQANAKFTPPGQTEGSLRKLAATRLVELRKIKIPSVLFPAFLPAALTELYLRGQFGYLRRQWRLWQAAKREKL